MINDIILRAVYEGVTYDLDVDNSVPLRLDISAVQNTEIGQVFGIGSQDFFLPGTNNNNRFFKHAYNLSSEDIPGFYSSVESYVILNGESVLDGKMMLKEVVTDEEGFTTYNVSVEDSTVQFNEVLKDKFLYQADWSDMDHTLNATSITSSWFPRAQGDFVSGSVFYPLCDYGFGKEFPLSDVPRLSTDIVTGSSATGSTPLKFQQFIPAVGVREVFNKIFDQAGFSYTSSLIDSAEFDNLFILFKNQEELGVVTNVTGDQNFMSASLTGLTQMAVVGPGGTLTQDLIYSGSEYDPGSNYNAATGEYTIPASGEYTFEAIVKFNNSSNDFTGYSLDLQYTPPGTTEFIDSIQLSSADNANPYVLSGSATLTLAQGVVVKPQFTIDNDLAASSTDVTDILDSGSRFAVTSAPIDYEDLPVTMSLQIDDSIKTIDIFRGLIEQFNLVVVPESYQDKTLRIETFDTWIRDGERKDWTDKYNKANRISVASPLSEQPREIRFENNTDSDRISQLTQEQTPNFQYGTVRTISDSDVTSGEQTLGSFFAPSVLAPTNTEQRDFFTDQNSYVFNQGASRYIVPHFYKYNNNKLEAFKFKPRIGYRTYYTGSSVGESDLYSPTNQFLESGSGTVSFTNYSTLSNYKNYPVTTTTKDLLYNSSYTKLSNNTSLYPSTGSSNYKNYWETYIESLYWTGGKKVTMDLYFEPYEYQQIRLNDQIIINNQLYRINKIKGFNITKRDVVSVELIRLYPEYIKTPQGPPEITGSCTPFSGSVRSTVSPTDACSLSITAPWVHNGTGTYPQVGDLIAKGCFALGARSISGWIKYNDGVDKVIGFHLNEVTSSATC